MCSFHPEFTTLLFFFCSTQLSSACYNPSFMSLLHAFTACRYSLFHHLLHSLSSLCFSVLLLSQSISLPAQTRSIIVSGQSLPLLPKVRLSVRSLDRSAGSNKPRAERSGAEQTQQILPRGGAEMSPENLFSGASRPLRSTWPSVAC